MCVCVNTSPTKVEENTAEPCSHSKYLINYPVQKKKITLLYLLTIQVGSLTLCLPQPPLNSTRKLWAAPVLVQEHDLLMHMC